MTGEDGMGVVKTEPKDLPGLPLQDPVHGPEDEDPPEEDHPKGSGILTKAALKVKPGTSKAEPLEEPSKSQVPEEEEEEDDENENDNEDKEENEDEGNSQKEEAPDISHKVTKSCFGKFKEDTDLANFVRGALLGLGG